MLEPGAAGDSLGRLREEHERTEFHVLLRRATAQMQQDRHRDGGNPEKIEREKETHGNRNPAMFWESRRGRFCGENGFMNARSG
jgi:hypothetical protein